MVYLEKTVFSKTSCILTTLNTIFQSNADPFINGFFDNVGNVGSWLCCSDYVFDPNKPNNVVTYTFYPNIPIFTNNYKAHIQKTLPVDIKKARNIRIRSLELNRAPFIASFSFIITNHSSLQFSDVDKMIEIFKSYCRMFIEKILPVMPTDTEKQRINKKRVNIKINSLVHLLEGRKKIELIKRMVLITIIGAYLSAYFANKTGANSVVWLSDRDAINEVGDMASEVIFNLFYHDMLIDKSCKFGFAPAQSQNQKWYEEFNRLPDYICGTLADFDMTTCEHSHDKFVPFIREYIASKDANVFVFNMEFRPLDNQVQLQRRTFIKNPL